MKKTTPIITKHILIPEHSKLNEKEKKELYDKYKITFNELPKILETDPQVVHLGAKQGDVIKIVRKSTTAGESSFYRGVANV